MPSSQSSPLIHRYRNALKSLFKATIYNFSANLAVFYVPANCTVKHLKERYAEEASNPLSDILYPLDPETNKRPDPISGGAFVPASVLVLFDDYGRQLDDDTLLFPHLHGESPDGYHDCTYQKFMTTLTYLPEYAGLSIEEIRLQDYLQGRTEPSMNITDYQCGGFSAQLVIPTFGADMPEFYSLLEKQNDCEEDMKDPSNPPDDWTNPHPDRLVPYEEHLAAQRRMAGNPTQLRHPVSFGSKLTSTKSLWGRVYLTDKATIVACKKAALCWYMVRHLSLKEYCPVRSDTADNEYPLFERRVFDDLRGPILEYVICSWSNEDRSYLRRLSWQYTDEAEQHNFNNDFITRMLFHMTTELFARVLGLLFYSEIMTGFNFATKRVGEIISRLRRASEISLVDALTTANRRVVAAGGDILSGYPKYAYFQVFKQWGRHRLGLSDLELLFDSLFGILKFVEVDTHTLVPAVYEYGRYNGLAIFNGFFQRSLEEILNLTGIDKDSVLGVLSKRFCDFYYTMAYNETITCFPRNATVLSNSSNEDYTVFSADVLINFEKPKHVEFIARLYCRFMKKHLSQSKYEELCRSAEADFFDKLHEQCKSMKRSLAEEIQAKEERERDCNLDGRDAPKWNRVSTVPPMGGYCIEEARRRSRIFSCLTTVLRE